VLIAVSPKNVPLGPFFMAIPSACIWQLFSEFFMNMRGDIRVIDKAAYSCFKA